MTRVVAWNVLSGGSKRIGRMATALGSLNPSVIVLSEVTAGRLAEWTAALTSIGQVHQTNTVGLVTSSDPYGLIVASTIEHNAVEWEQSPPCPNRVLRVRVNGLEVVAVHAPDQPGPAEPFYRWLLDAAAPLLSTEAMVIGDVNADQDGDGIPLARFFLPLVESGWIHGLRHQDPDGDHTSWWGRLRGFPIDHCLVSPSLAGRASRIEILASIDGIATCGRDLRVSDGALSDHRPLLVDLT